MISFLRQLFLEDFWLKLFALILAVLIWLTVSLAIRKEVSPVPAAPAQNTAERVFFNLPVVVYSLAEDVHSFRVNPQEVSVTVQGERKALETLRGQDIGVTVNLTHLDGTPLRKRIDVSTPVGIMHVRVEPPEVEVLLPPKS
jgi:YbbR domain-containing protein